jgi:hypothetical protein
MTRTFASAGDMTEKTISFDEIGPGLYAFTAEGDPNTGVIIGDDSVMIVEAQATPRLARKVIDCVRSVTDKPISHLVLTHYHAVRVLGASAYGAGQIIMSDAARAMVVERGQEDWDSEFPLPAPLLSGMRNPRPHMAHDDLFRGDDGLSRQPAGRHLMHRAARIRRAMRWSGFQTPNVMFTGDIVEYHSACYCGDGHLQDWGDTLDVIARVGPQAIAPGRGAALIGPDMVAAAIESTRDFVASTYAPAARVAARGGSAARRHGTQCVKLAIRNSPITRSMSIACPSMSPVPMTRRAASTHPASGPPNAMPRCGRPCRSNAW